jgi:ribosomal protein S18 acetylase RimI-like enzyme
MLEPDFRLDDRNLSRREITKAGVVAGRAFNDGPFFEFLFPDEVQRVRSLQIIHRTVFRHPGPGALLRTVRDSQDDPVGLSLWIPTGRYPLSTMSQLSQLPGSLRAFFRRRGALKIGVAYSRATASLHPTEPHWYLWVLMCDPAMQGRGIGTALMNDGLAHIDAEGVGAYLETNNETNVAFYARFGFVLRNTVQPVADGPPLFAMWRDVVTPIVNRTNTW